MCSHHGCGVTIGSLSVSSFDILHSVRIAGTKDYSWQSITWNLVCTFQLESATKNTAVEQNSLRVTFLLWSLHLLMFEYQNSIGRIGGSNKSFGHLKFGRERRRLCIFIALAHPQHVHIHFHVGQHATSKSLRKQNSSEK